MKRFYIQWHLVDRCNLRCRHCYQEKFTRDGELSLEELRKVADNLLQTMKKWGAKLDIPLTGGEPLLKEETFELVDYLSRSRNIAGLSLITNGTLLRKKAKEIKSKKKLKEIKISIDGLNQETNDSIRGNGIWAQLLDNIESAKEWGKPIFLMFTVMKKNLAEVQDLPDFSRKLGFRGFIVERFFPLGRGKDFKENVLSGEEFLGVWQTILTKCNHQARPRELISYRAIKVILEGKKSKVFGSECIVGKDGLALLPDGTALPCRRFVLPLGNLLSAPLWEIWQESEVLRLVRQKTNFSGRCGECEIEDCSGCRAMNFCLRGDFLREDPHCWL